MKDFTNSGQFKYGQNVKDLTGKKYGKLTVLRRATQSEINARGVKNTKGNVYWLVQCACGIDPFIVLGFGLTGKDKRRKTQSQQACKKCSDRDRGLKERKIFLNKIIGKQSGRLTILRYWGTNKDGNIKVICSCSCDDIKTPIYRYNTIKAGKAISCGCVVGGDDSFQFFKENEDWANRKCYYYIADKDDEFYKLGISEKKSTRARDEGYRKYLFEPDLLTRCEVWTIEQLILNDSVMAKTRVMPERLEKMEGKWELRYKDTFNLNFYRQKYFEYLEKLQSLGWEELYLTRFDY